MKAAQGFSTLRRWLAASRHILANTGLANVDAQLEQFAVDARCSPKRIVAAHLANQVPRFLGDGRWFCCEIGGRRLVPWRGMPITPTNPFKGRHFPGEVIVQCVRWSCGQNTQMR